MFIAMYRRDVSQSEKKGTNLRFVKSVCSKNDTDKSTLWNAKHERVCVCVCVCVNECL